MDNIENYRKELDELILYYNYDMKNEEVIKKSIEVENNIYNNFRET